MSEIIFVTGAAGFLGSHIVDQLLAKGYAVRAAARGAKAEHLRTFYADLGERFEVVSIPDIAKDQFPDALKGVHAVIHTASPIDASNAEAALTTAIEGTMNVILQAEQAGVKKIISTSSMYAVMNPKYSFTDKDWNPVTREEALSGNAEVTYAASKTLSERAVWEFADAHPDIDITTFCPPFLYGAFAPSFAVPTPNHGALSTNVLIHRLLTPDGAFPRIAGHADIRDVARAHVLALTAPPTSVVGRKRILLSSPHASDFAGAVRLVAEKRPELKDRLVDVAKAPQYPLARLPVDFGRIEDVLGMNKEEFRTWEETVLDTVDALIKIEEGWKSKGYEFEIPVRNAANW